MDIRLVLRVALLLLVALDSSDASVPLNSRKLVGVTPKDNSSSVTQPSPVAGVNGWNQSKADADKQGKDKSKDSQRQTKSSDADPKSKNSGNNPLNSGHSVSNSNSKTGAGESCDDSAKPCKEQKDKAACHGKDCVPHSNPPVSVRNIVQQLSLYSKKVTPIYGAYFLLLVTLVLGITWGFCKFRKRKRQGGIPYQELEMGLPESAAATELDTAGGWDQEWGDDWDEDDVVKSPGGGNVAGISVNGLTSRSSKKDGWEKD